MKYTKLHHSLLYKQNKLYRKLFNLMFDKFGWDATAIDEDCLTIYKLVVRYYDKEKK